MSPRLSTDEGGSACSSLSPSPAKKSPVIRFESVTKQYGGQSRPALDDVNVEVEKG